mgnify:CR=1 FL=1
MKTRIFKACMIATLSISTLFITKYSIHADEATTTSTTTEVTKNDDNTYTIQNNDKNIEVTYSTETSTSIPTTTETKKDDNISTDKNTDKTLSTNHKIKIKEVKTKVNKTMYVTAKDGLNIRRTPNTNKKSKGTLPYRKKVKVITTIENSHWVQIRYGSSDSYVSKNFLSYKRPKKLKKKKKKSYTSSYKYNGPKLTRRKGVNYGPSGKETYYNMRMTGVIRNMRRRGYTGRYWIRNDGAKMLGSYIMVAANLRVRPYGTKVRTSLGMGIVCDTGSFASSNPTQLDIAVNW